MPDRYQKIPNGQAVIYGLKDPRDGLFYYVGKTTNPLARSKAHWSERLRDKTDKHKWLLELEHLGMRPEFHILDRCIFRLWQDKERAWISRLSGANPLLNANGGGAGSDSAIDLTEDMLYKILRELVDEVEQVRGRRTWPTLLEFFEAGLGGVRNRIEHFGGYEVWANKLNTSLPVLYKWTRSEAEQVLEQYLSDKSEYPSSLKFKEDGLGGLYIAIMEKLGGHDQYADKYQLVRGGNRSRWTEARVEREMKEFTEGRSTYPTKKEFSDADRYKLYAAILKRFGGHDLWAKKLGLSRPTRELWCEDKVRLTLSEFVKGRTEWPSKDDFVDAGLAKLYQAIHLRYGGCDYWSKEFDLPRKYKLKKKQAAARG